MTHSPLETPLSDTLFKLAALPPERKTFSNNADFRVAVSEWIRPLERDLNLITGNISDVAKRHYAVRESLPPHSLRPKYMYKIPVDLALRRGDTIDLYVRFKLYEDDSYSAKHLKSEQENERVFASAKITPLDNKSVQKAVAKIAQDLVKLFPEEVDCINSFAVSAFASYPLPPKQPSLISKILNRLANPFAVRTAKTENPAPTP